LLQIAQGGEERSRLTSELELVTTRFSLEDMEDALHQEVAALKHGAIGQTDGDAASTNVTSIDVAAWEDKLAQSRKDQSAASEKRIEGLEQIHQKAIEELRTELNFQKEAVGKLESEAEEMKERLKKLAKLEKNEKGLSAMTEELKKMEAETGLSVGLDSTLEFASMEGDLSREDEARLIEELENARDEIKNMKMRQAMVTHELLGNIKGANAEVEMLKAALIDMTAQRDARMDMSNLAEMGSVMSGADAEEFRELKEEAKAQKKKNSAVQKELQETLEALLMLLEELRKSCKDTTRAKAKVWNLRDLERARSIPPPGKPSIAGDGNGVRTNSRVPTAVQRLSAADASGRNGGRAPSKTSSVAAADSDGGMRGRSGEGGGGRGDGSRGQEQPSTSATGEERKQAELEKRRQDRAAQATAKKLLAEAEEKEVEEFQQACAFPQSEGVALALEKLRGVQTDVKEQFKEVFFELKEALETHKKFVMRSRVEAREVTGKMTSLEVELDRLRALQNSTEEQLRGRSTVLAQTQLDLNAEKSAGVATRRDLAAAQAEARENVFFRDKNADLQKQLDHAEISSRRAKQESEKV
ncbi:unnamed protein product, partial [Hapterophycus canaliculatus]